MGQPATRFARADGSPQPRDSEAMVPVYHISTFKSSWLRGARKHTGPTMTSDRPGNWKLPPSVLARFSGLLLLVPRPHRQREILAVFSRKRPSPLRAHRLGHHA